MMRRQTALKKLLSWLLVSIGPSAYLEGLRWMAGTPFSLSLFTVRLAFGAGLTLVAQLLRPYSGERAEPVWPWANAIVGAGGVVAILVYALGESTWAAWALLAAAYLLLLGLETALTLGQGDLKCWSIRGLLALVAGGVPVVIWQIESQFAGEEFFVALQALALGLFWLLLLPTRSLLPRLRPRTLIRGFRLDRRRLSLGLLLLMLSGLGATARAYQHSFYSSEAPSYSGISRDAPMLCGEVQSNTRTFDGEQVFRDLLARVEANPRKGTPEYGMLAVATGEWRWAVRFRNSILEEAAEGRYTGPAHSVKSSQYKAALRAYYFPRVDAAFPDLFSSEDRASLKAWFADINRRALTVEWVDWMYALAFTKRPEGPYENQEIGAGLLALLESQGLAANDLSSANQDYLERNPRGWVARFRNTDDALIYQPEWINNAYFQSLYTDNASRENIQLSFEWLLAQALPDGSRLGYNHPSRVSLAGVAYLGASILEDPRYLWLAGQALHEAETEGDYLFAQPGIEAPVSMESRSPSLGSCLLYGDSGLPNQIGPLAPDKIVFRDGWSEQSLYLLLNLRFTGWHRYKASNTVALIYQREPLVEDLPDRKRFKWLPMGRSQFRDKRIPRENLNGLQVRRTGMSSVLHQLTGVGGPWAQDPPRYADVIAFETGDPFDWSHTRLAEWRGWQHDRQVFFYHDAGPIVVADKALGPEGRQAALDWHFNNGESTADDGRVILETGKGPVEVLFVPMSPGGRLDITQEDGPRGRIEARYDASFDGQLDIATVFLPGRWVGAQAAYDREESVLRITDGQTAIAIPLGIGE